MKTAAASLLYLLISGVIATAASAAAAADPNSGDLVRRKFEAFNRHDADAIEKIYARDANLRSPDYSGLKGNVQIADTYRRIFDAIPDAQDKLEALEVSSNHVYAQFVLVGHFKGAPDKPVNVRIISVYAVRNGHIVDDVTYYDRKAP